MFTFQDIVQQARGVDTAKVASSILKRRGALYIHGRDGRRRLYRLCDPGTLMHLMSGRLVNLASFKQGRYPRLIGLAASELLSTLPSLRCITVYGSIARGTARLDSDLDMLVVADFKGSLGERLDSLLEVETSCKVSRELNWLSDHSVETHILFLPLTPNEFQEHPPILLDIVYDGIAVYDDDFYSWGSRDMRERLEALGARRVFLAKDEWYWDLKPGFKLLEASEV